MSEFTAGVLFLKPNLARVEQQMRGFPRPYITRELNDKWGVLFVEGDNYDDLPLKAKLLELSQSFPLLSFQNPEDHGWGYSVYNGGAETASLDVSYEMGFNYTLNLAEQRYPDAEDYYGPEFWDTWQELAEEVLASDVYRGAIIQQYDNLNFHALEVFGVDARVIKMLEHVISPETYFDGEKLLRQSEVFRDALGINEMEWMSYHYVTLGDEGAE